MTRKDYRIVAAAISDIEFELWTEPERERTSDELIELVVDGLCVAFKAENHRFDRDRFELAARPLYWRARAEQAKRQLAEQRAQ